MITVGVLALQGSFAEHQNQLVGCGVSTQFIRETHQLETIQGLIIPGGESTALTCLFKNDRWMQALKFAAQKGLMIWGSCAGAIVLARCANSNVISMGLLDLDFARNGFGRQSKSFIAPVEGPICQGKSLDSIFIRAPRIQGMGQEVVPLGWMKDGEVVAAGAGRIMVTTFHPEIGKDLSIYQWFVELVLCPNKTIEAQDRPST